MKNIIVIICTCFVLTGCKALIEENIRTEKVNVLFPKNGDSISSYNVNFWWDNVNGASSYEIQLVQGTFSNIQNFIADSFTNSNRLNFVLTPGNYAWKIRALNNSTSTDFATQSFTVVRNDSLGTQSVILQYPPDNYVTNINTQTFKWYPIAQTTYYTFQLLTAAGSLIYSSDVMTDSVVMNNIQQGDLIWRVRASSNSASTPFSARSIYIDTITPNVPTLLSPSYGDSVTVPVSLTWDRGSVTGVGISDSVFIYSDSLMTIYQRNSSSSSSYSLPTIPVGTYFWRIKSTDLAGNSSSLSIPGKFKVY